MFFEGEGIKFDDALWESEEFALGGLFRQRRIYAIRSSIELGFGDNQKGISENYYIYARKQRLWFKEYIRKILKNSFDVFFIMLALGHKTAFGKIVTEYIDINDFEIPEASFTFEPLTIYQFVDNIKEHMEWMKEQIEKDKNQWI